MFHIGSVLCVIAQLLLVTPMTPMTLMTPLVVQGRVCVHSLVTPMTLMTLMTPLFVQGRAAYERLFEKDLGDRPGRYYNDKIKDKCTNCRQRGHSQKDCPWPKVQ